jgi:Zn-dependent M28 family amino/carboxypeptidase
MTTRDPRVREPTRCRPPGNRLPTTNQEIKMKRSLLLLTAILLPALAAFGATATKLTGVKSGAESSAIPAAVKRELAQFDPNRLKAHDRFLASDLLEGRGPGTRGDELAMQYIASQFEAYGLIPGADNGTWYQKVPLLGITTLPDKSSASFVRNSGETVAGPLKYLDEWVGTDLSQNESSKLDSDIVFVGHGVVAPEYRWDDYKGLDVRGKTLVMLVDDPPASAQEPDLFKGKTRTYYGRWTYKFEIGAAKGAAGVILVHTNDAAGYPWSVVRNSWGKETDYVKLQPGQPALHFAGWVTEPVAASLIKAAGHDLDKLTRDAASRDFKPVPLNIRLTGQLTSALRTFETANVVARLEGSDPTLRQEAILYSAHHDHLGIGKADERGDTIYNGAIDNASGCAVLLEMARVWAGTHPRPKRSILFAAVAAEEQGLIGSQFYGEHPTIPAGRIALDINYDAVFEVGRVRNVTMNGAERTSFFPAATRVAKALGQRIDPDEAPEQGHYFRSDHFSLAKAGIPAFTIDTGNDLVDGGIARGKQLKDEYRTRHYHQPSDEFDESWNWIEGVQMAQLGYWLGWDAAQSTTKPNWLPGDEFRAVRDKSLAALK